MAMLNFDMDLQKQDNFSKAFTARQGDAGEQFSVTLFDNQVPYVPASGDVVSLRVVTPSGKFASVVGTMSDNKATFTLNSQITSEAGYYQRAYVAVSNGTKLRTTQDLIFFSLGTSDINKGQADYYVAELDKLLQQLNEEFDEWLAEREQDYSNLLARIVALTNRVTGLEQRIDEQTEIFNNADVYNKAEIEDKLEPFALRTDIAELSAQLAQTASKTQWVNPIAFGAKGDGVTDDTVALQNACDYAYQHNLAFIVPSREYNFLISQPIYLDRYTIYDFNWSTITKTTNNVGSGATSTKGNITSKSTKVDAFFIGREPADFALTFMELKRVNFKRTAPNRVKYGLYVDLVQQCKISDLFSYQDTEGKKGATDYLCYGSMWCMMDEFRNISQYWGIKTLVLTGATIPGSTSLNIENIVGGDQEGCLDLKGAPYCTITNPMIDRCNGVAFQFSSCPEVTITSPSVENLRRTGRYLVLSASGIVITTPRLIYLQGASSERALITVDNNSRLTVLGGNFPAYENQVSSAFDLNFIITNSVVHLVHTILPTNGNDYIGLAQGASITYVNRDGTTYRDADGRGSKANGLRTLYRPEPPTAGTYKKGEKILNTYTTNQEVEYWVCVEAGSPGIWEARKAHKLEVTRSAVWTGDGVTKTFSATHGLGYIPTYFTVTPENSTSGVAEISHVTVTATQINVSFKTAIPSAEVAIVKWLVR